MGKRNIYFSFTRRKW